VIDPWGCSRRKTLAQKMEHAGGAAAAGGAINVPDLTELAKALKDLPQATQAFLIATIPFFIAASLMGVTATID
jgi:hypothetical protein